MRIAAIFTMIVLAAIDLAAAETTVKSMSHRVAACMHYEENPADASLARIIAAKMFRDIGVTLVWIKPHACPADGIHISLDRNTPDNFRPDALAYALPFEGATIRVFLDRIGAFQHALLPHVLAYVLVHEIAHILQGFSRHADQGVMKAHWSGRDLYMIQGDVLKFDPEDVDLIQQGLISRHW